MRSVGRQSRLTGSRIHVPGQGSEHVHMGLELYTSEKVFRQEVDQCLDIVAPYHAENLREILYEGDMGFEAKAAGWLANLLPDRDLCNRVCSSKGVDEMGCCAVGFVGHSIGEYTAACLAGVFSLEMRSLWLQPEADPWNR